MNINSTFKGKYLAASDIEDEDLIVTIAGLQIEKVGQTKEDKPVLYFQEEDRGMVLNKTNAATISAMYGSETDEWMGKRIALFVATVDFKGETKPAIRIKGRPPKTSTPSKPQTAAPPPAATGRPGQGAPSRREALKPPPQVDDDEWDENNPVF